MWKLIHTELKYMNSRCLPYRYTFLGIFILAYAITGSYFYYGTTLKERVLLCILPTLYVSYILSVLMYVIIDTNENRFKTNLALPIPLNMQGFIKPCIALSMFLSFILLYGYSGYAIFQVNEIFYNNSDIDQQLCGVEKIFSLMLLVTFVLWLIPTSFGRVTLFIIASLLALLWISPWFRLYYEEQLDILYRSIITPAGSSIIALICFLIMYLDWYFKRQWSTLITHFSIISDLTRSEISYMSSRLKLHYQLILLFIVLFLFTVIIDDYFLEYEIFNNIMTLVMVTLTLIYCFNQIELLRGEYFHRRVKYLSPLPVKYIDVNLARIINPVVPFLLLIVFGSIFFYFPYREWSNNSEGVLMFFSIVAVSTFSLRLLSESKGRILFFTIAGFLIAISLLKLNTDNYTSYYSTFHIFLTDYINTFWEFIAMPIGATLVSAIFLSVIWISFSTRKSFLH
jgi:hypothetical protein